MEKRIITTDITEEDIQAEGSLRPQSLDEYIGQEKTKENLKIYIEAAKQRNDLWTTCCFTALPAWERQRWPASSPMKWAST